jgi:replication factor C subunit 2/4
VVPDPIINDFARVLGIDIEDEMDIDVPQYKQGGFEPIKNKVKFLMREGYSATQILLQVCFYVLF